MKLLGVVFGFLAIVYFFTSHNLLLRTQLFLGFGIIAFVLLVLVTISSLWERITGDR